MGWQSNSVMSWVWSRALSGQKLRKFGHFNKHVPLGKRVLMTIFVKAFKKRLAKEWKQCSQCKLRRTCSLAWLLRGSLARIDWLGRVLACRLAADRDDSLWTRCCRGSMPTINIFNNTDVITRCRARCGYRGIGVLSKHGVIKQCESPSSRSER